MMWIAPAITYGTETLPLTNEIAGKQNDGAQNVEDCEERQKKDQLDE